MSKRLVYGVGVNDADYVVQIWETTGYVDGKQKQKLVWGCPFYNVWVNMLKRGYSKKFKAVYPTYEECSVCKEWLLFSTFKAWMETQDWEGKQLDKDLLIGGNKVYGSETCVFVSGVVNNFILECFASRGEHMVGCCWNKNASKFMARCSNPFTKKLEYLGYFTSELEAHQAWLKRKLELACELADIQTDIRVHKALKERYENYGQ